jgi:hypothetical protein
MTPHYSLVAWEVLKRGHAEASPAPAGSFKSAYRRSAKLDPNLSTERLAGRCPLSGLWCIYILPDVLGSFDLTHMGPGVRGSRNQKKCPQSLIAW